MNIRAKVVNAVTWRKGMGEPYYITNLIGGFARIKGEAKIFIPVRIVHNRILVSVDREISRCLKNSK